MFFCVRAALCCSALGASMEFSMLTRKHGLKICPGFSCSVEECGLAVADVVGAKSIISAARMNGAVVIFVDEVVKANEVITNGIVINDTFVSVMPLASPSRRVIVSNVPPFISDEVLERELSRHGKIVSPIKKVLTGCKSPLLQHVVSHRRQLFMILNNSSTELSVTFRLKIEGIDYILFATSDVMRCFGCGKEGHVIRVCPEKPAASRQTEPDLSAGEGTSGVKTKRLLSAQHLSDKDKGEKSTSVVKETIEKADVGSEEEGEEVTQVSEPLQSNIAVDIHVDADSAGEEGVGGGDEGGGDEGVKENSEVAEIRNEEIPAESEVEEMEESSSVSISRQKRKAGEINNSGSTAKKATVNVRKGNEEQTEEDEEAESDSTFEGFLDEELEEEEELYDFEAIKGFLKETKGVRGTKLRNYFPNKELFVNSVKPYMKITGNGGFTEQEKHRLNKMVGVINKELNGKDGKNAGKSD